MSFLDLDIQTTFMNSFRSKLINKFAIIIKNCFLAESEVRLLYIVTPATYIQEYSAELWVTLSSFNQGADSYI